MFTKLFKKLFGTNEPERVGVTKSETVLQPSTRPVQSQADSRAVLPVTVSSTPISRKDAKVRKRNMNPKKYYKRGGKYYSGYDGSLIEDLLDLYILTEMFSDDEVGSFEEYQAVEEAAPTEDLLEMDVSSTPVEAAPVVDIFVAPEPEPYVAPAPEPSYSEPSYSSSSSSYSDSSSSYDSGSSSSSDSGGGGGSDD